MKTDPKKKNKSEKVKPLHHPNSDAGGIDMAANEIWVAIPAERDEMPIRRFGAFTEDLQCIVQWLLKNAIRTVAMESTGVYWIGLYQLLADAGIEVCLVNARHVKNVPGRKSDVQDCQWLQYLHSVGLLRASFRPDQAICAARSIYRYRQNLRVFSAEHIQHRQAALDQMNMKLHHVINDVMGKSGMAIIQDIVNGERNPLRLAKHRDFRIKASEEKIVKSLSGDWRSEHLFVLRLALENWQHTQRQIEICDQQLLDITRELEGCPVVAEPIKRVRLAPQGTMGHPALGPKKLAKRKTKNEPDGPWHQELQRFFGVDLTAIPGISVLSAISLMSELGHDLSAFKTAHHFSSWLCLCPDNQTSASKILSRRTRRSENRLRQTLRLAASTLYRDKSYLGDKFRRLRAKLGAPKAITAMAHRLARIIWHLLTYRVPFDLSVFAAHEQAHEIRRLQRLAANARQMGYQLTPITP